MEKLSVAVEFLKGKKTYLLVGAAFIYGGGIQIGLWPHNSLVDYALAGGTAAALRAGSKNDAQKVVERVAAQPSA